MRRGFGSIGGLQSMPVAPLLALRVGVWRTIPTRSASEGRDSVIISVVRQSIEMVRACQIGHPGPEHVSGFKAQQAFADCNRTCFFSDGQ